jgi:HPr kinase/phosphorylase
MARRRSSVHASSSAYQRCKGVDSRNGPTLHGSAVLVGARAIVIRGPSGAGKSLLALRLMEQATAGTPVFARLVADDRMHVEARNGRLLIRPAENLAGLIEVRGLGLRRLPFEPVAVAGLLVDLAAIDAERMPPCLAGTIRGVTLPRLAVAAGVDPLPLIGAALNPRCEPIEP